MTTTTNTVSQQSDFTIFGGATGSSDDLYWLTRSRPDSFSPDGGAGSWAPNTGAAPAAFDDATRSYQQ